MEENKGDKPKGRSFGGSRTTKRSDNTDSRKFQRKSTANRPARTSRIRREENQDEEPRSRRFNRTEKLEFKERKSRNTRGDKFEKSEGSDFKPRKSFKDKEERPSRKFGAKRTENKDFGEKSFGNRKTFKKSFSDEKAPRKRRRDVTAESEILSEIVAKRKQEGRTSPQKQKVLSLADNEKQGLVRLNKYIANAGICSRREADVLISTGAVSVNDEVITELGYKVKPTDVVRYGDKVLQNEKPVYLLLNKPKDYITTTFDDRGRKDVMELVSGACKERIYPVGRLDRDTTGLLLFTNDGDMTKKLTHPSHGIEKTYHVELNKNFANIDMCALRQGIELEDGVITPDEVAFVGESKRDLGITIHSGKNRIVRRIFEFLGYEVVKLDRVVFAGLTKKDLPRGKWRFLTQAEINILKMTIK